MVETRARAVNQTELPAQSPGSRGGHRQQTNEQVNTEAIGGHDALERNKAGQSMGVGCRCCGGFPDKVAFGRDLKEMREAAMWRSVGKVFQRKGIAAVRALRCAQGWHVGSTARSPVWLTQGSSGERNSRGVRMGSAGVSGGKVEWFSFFFFFF